MIVWGDKRPGSEVVICRDPESPCIVVGPLSPGDWVRIPADFPDPQMCSRAVQIEQIVLAQCPLQGHDHEVKMLLLPAGIRVFECAGQFQWCRLKGFEGPKS